ncbi:MAG TPA: hypothetical protein P5048_01600 [Chlamydiales bacterium]|nr:hypothetical protein [Chlamydiales bacterium]
MTLISSSLQKDQMNKPGIFQFPATLSVYTLKLKNESNSWKKTAVNIILFIAKLPIFLLGSIPSDILSIVGRAIIPLFTKSSNPFSDTESDEDPINSKTETEIEESSEEEIEEIEKPQEEVAPPDSEKETETEIEESDTEEIEEIEKPQEEVAPPTSKNETETETEIEESDTEERPIDFLSETENNFQSFLEDPPFQTTSTKMKSTSLRIILLVILGLQMYSCFTIQKLKKTL